LVYLIQKAYLRDLKLCEREIVHWIWKRERSTCEATLRKRVCLLNSKTNDKTKARERAGHKLDKALWLNIL
jgi:hypothetical protein